MKVEKNAQEYDHFLSKDIEYNEIINIHLLSEALKGSVCNKFKEADISVRFVKQVVGLATELSIFCTTCQKDSCFLTSKFVEKTVNNRKLKLYNVNTRLTYAMRSIGRGKAAAKMFCGVMNFPNPASTISFQD